MSIRDITTDTKNINFNNERSRKQSKLNEINCGLYLMLFENPKEIEIKDRNKTPKTGFSGKVVIPPNSRVAKFGKFEDGLINRLRGYQKHLHYANDATNPIFQDVLKEIICLDLSNLKKTFPKLNPAKIFEPYWNQSLHHWLLDSGLLHQNQNIRSEYRILRDTTTLPATPSITNTVLLYAIADAINTCFPIFCHANSH